MLIGSEVCLALTLLFQQQHYEPRPPTFPDGQITTWCWEPSPHSDWCLLYFSPARGYPWIVLDMVHASVPCTGIDVRADLPYGLSYLVVTCLNEHGESSTEHGDYPGDLVD